MRTDRFALADLGQQDRLDEIVTDAARGLEDTFDVNERSNTSTGKSTDGDLHDLASDGQVKTHHHLGVTTPPAGSSKLLFK
jgi:hypothetical protein